MSTTATAPTTPAAPTAGPDAPVRASDAEREAVVTRLHDALGQGRLDLSETETRVAAAYAARHRHDLPPLLRDLPGSSPFGTTGVPTWAAIVAAVLARLRLLLGTDPDGAPTTPRAAGPRRPGRVVVVVLLVLGWLLLCAVAGALVA